MVNEISPITATAAQSVKPLSAPAVQVERERVQEVAASKQTDPGRDDEGGRSGEGMRGTVTELNRLAQGLRRELNFSVDDASGETVITVVDKETNEVIRQIPPEEVIRLRERLSEVAGVIFKESA